MEVIVEIYENHKDRSNKFYTIVHMQDGTFHANYGTDSENGWSKTKVYSTSELDKVKRTRVDHGYTHIKTLFVKKEHYLLVKEKLGLLYEYPEAKPLWYKVQKTGKLSADDMIIANRIFQKNNKETNGQIDSIYVNIGNCIFYIASFSIPVHVIVELAYAINFWLKRAELYRVLRAFNINEPIIQGSDGAKW